MMDLEHAVVSCDVDIGNKQAESVGCRLPYLPALPADRHGLGRHIHIDGKIAQIRDNSTHVADKAA